MKKSVIIILVAAVILLIVLMVTGVIQPQNSPGDTCSSQEELNNEGAQYNEPRPCDTTEETTWSKLKDMW
jgi:hypothetical protein